MKSKSKVESAAMSNNTVTIKAPKFETAVFQVKGIAPLVMHRFSQRPGPDGLGPLDRPPPGVKRKKSELTDEQKFDRSRYISKEGWDGIHAGAFRSALISACRLVGFKMTMAKMSVFVVADGWDKEEPQIPLVRIRGEAIMQKDVARVETGQPYVTVRAAYHNWRVNLRVRWDADQFTLTDLSNLLSRVGLQVGVGEGRPDSKKSAGMGWGLFEIASK